jgi:hypothetical protein
MELAFVIWTAVIVVWLSMKAPPIVSRYDARFAFLSGGNANSRI